MIKIAVLGYGTVGSGVVEVLETNRDIITPRAGEEIEVKYVLDLRDFPGNPIQDRIVHDYDVILKDEEIRIVVEVMGGMEPALTYTKQAMMAGKSVATSNKELVAAHGAELIALARQQNVNYMFEASVGGGIPIIRPLNESLTPEDLLEITGILNGTTNYMLTRMSEDGLDYDEVLKDAQANGFAERNPKADVEGLDACRKLAILTSLSYGKNVDPKDIYTEGITKITDMDFKYANQLGVVIKLLSTCKKENGKIYAAVFPEMIDSESPLYSVDDVFNAIYVKGNMLGPAMFYGQGAGKRPTASAVVSDVIEEARHLNENLRVVWSSEKLELADIKEASHRFFVRISGDPDQKGNRVRDLFGHVPFVQVTKGEFGFVTDEMKEKYFDEKAKKLDGVLTRIRGDF